MWLIFPKTGGEALRANMNKLCESVLSHLNKNSFFPILQTLLTKGLARAKPAFKKTQLVAIVTLALRMLQVCEVLNKLKQPVDLGIGIGYGEILLLCTMCIIVHL